MAYRIDPSRGLDAEIRRIAGEQIDKAVKRLEQREGDPHASVHDARKRLKKLRGLIRLVREAQPKFYKAENARFRDIARALSAVRDRAALIEAAEGLEAHFSGEAKDTLFKQPRATLRAALEEAEKGDLRPAMARAVEQLRLSQKRLETFVLKDANAGLILAEGAARVAGDARKALKAARRERDPDSFHELRKHAKYHMMHAQLLEPLWPAHFGAMRDEASAIADALGRDHDYAVMREGITEAPEDYGKEAQVSAFLALLDRHQSELREEGLARAGRLFAEDPAAFGKRLRRLYRHATRSAGAEAGIEERPDEKERKAQ